MVISLARRVVSTAKVQKIWEQFTTTAPFQYQDEPLFRLQKYKKFESNSQQITFPTASNDVVSTAKVQKIWEQFTTTEPNSLTATSCFDCKSTKNLRAIHNRIELRQASFQVVSTAKVQKIWEQFTTNLTLIQQEDRLFRLQKYKKFESNSQLGRAATFLLLRCFDCKSTKNLRAIHNWFRWWWFVHVLFRLQKYKKFESNSQLLFNGRWRQIRCFDCKSTKNLRAIHNESNINPTGGQVVSTAKVQKIWEQFTTRAAVVSTQPQLFRLQKYKKFESNSQHLTRIKKFRICCFDCKSTKNLRAIHNSI